MSTAQGAKGGASKAAEGKERRDGVISCLKGWFHRLKYRVQPPRHIFSRGWRRREMQERQMQRKTSTELAVKEQKHE